MGPIFLHLQRKSQPAQGGRGGGWRRRRALETCEAALNGPEWEYRPMAQSGPTAQPGQRLSQEGGGSGGGKWNWRLGLGLGGVGGVFCQIIRYSNLEKHICPKGHIIDIAHQANTMKVDT